MGSCTLLYKWTGRVNGWQRLKSLDEANVLVSVLGSCVSKFPGYNTSYLYHLPLPWCAMEVPFVLVLPRGLNTPV